MNKPSVFLTQRNTSEQVLMKLNRSAGGFFLPGSRFLAKPLPTELFLFHQDLLQSRQIIQLHHSL